MNKSAANGPVLVMIRGLPGSGKSYVARTVRERLGADSVVLLDPDATDYTSQEYLDFSSALTAEGVAENLHPYRYLRSQAYAATLEHKIIMWNQAFTHQDLLDRTIKNLQANATEHGEELPALVVEVSVELAIAKERVAKRAAAGGHDVTDETFERFFNDYKSFADYGYPIVAVAGTDDVEVSAEKIITGIESLRA